MTVPDIDPDESHCLTVAELEQRVCDQIEYDFLVTDSNRQELDEIVSIIVEVLAMHGEGFEVGGLVKPPDLVMKNFLPGDLAYDMNFHILSFEPGASHSFVETHVQEHGMYILEGEGVYLLDEDWRMIKKGDFVWFGPYCPQAAYATGRERFTYIYSKDCNRDVEI